MQPQTPKNKAIYAIVWLALLLPLLSILPSCNRDACNNVTCVHGTLAKENGGCNCLCDSNYKGQYCDTLIDRVKYGFLSPTGATTTWMCHDSCSANDTISYTATIFGDPSSDGVALVNFLGFGVQDTLYVQIGDNQCGFYGQVNFGNYALVDPIGTISGNGDTIVFTYKFGQNVASLNCTGVWVKQ
jgi:hypothetical protein